MTELALFHNAMSSCSQAGAASRDAALALALVERARGACRKES